MKNKYRSKIDVWVGVLLIAAVIVSILSMLVVAISGMSWWSILLQEALILALIILILSLLINTFYTISNQSISIRSGPFNWTIPFEAINLIEPSRKAWSSAALSLDRLYIEYDGKEVGSKSGIYISPVDKTRFMRDVADRTRNLQIEGERVVRLEE